MNRLNLTGNMLIFAGIAPHPPIIVPAVGGHEAGEADATVKAMQRWAESLATEKPETLVVITPHGPVFKNALGIFQVGLLEGSFGSFGAPDVNFKYSEDAELIKEIKDGAAQSGVPLAVIDHELADKYHFRAELDHGVMVPLYFVQETGASFSLVVISIGFLEYKDLVHFGEVLGDVLSGMNRRVALVASADLSHRLLSGAPAGYDPQGKVFDETVYECILEMNTKKLMNLPEDLIERAGECGLRPILILMGALAGRKVKPDIYSYEGPFGVGYLVANLKLTERKEAGKMNVSDQSNFTKLARASLEYYLLKGRYLEIPYPLPEEFADEAGVFVSINKRGKLRGCIGTIQSTKDNLAAEIIQNAVSSGLRDPRFPPVEAAELNQLEFSVDVLEKPEPVQDIGELDPKRYGVIVRSEGRVGLLLPNLEGVDTVEEQLAIARQKAGIGPEEPVEIERFLVTRYS